MNHFIKSRLLTALAFAALLLGVTAACNRDPIPIEVLEKELVGMWWDEYEYHDVTEDGVPFDRVLLFVGANEDHTGYLYLAAAAISPSVAARSWLPAIAFFPLPASVRARGTPRAETSLSAGERSRLKANAMPPESVLSPSAVRWAP